MGAPAPIEAVIWRLVEQTGWTLDYIESLPLARLYEWIQLQDARAKSDASRSRKGR